MEIIHSEAARQMARTNQDLQAVLLNLQTAHPLVPSDQIPQAPRLSSTVLQVDLMDPASLKIRSNQERILMAGDRTMEA